MVKMPAIGYPIDDFDYEIPDVDLVTATALITTQATVHKSASSNTTTTTT